MSEEKVFFPWDEGRPTTPDVDALLKAFPPETIKAGEFEVVDADVIRHIGDAGGTRFRTVTSAWRKRLKRDFSLNIFRRKEYGFYCPVFAQVAARTHPTLEEAGRKISSQMRSLSVAQPTNEIESAVKDHHGGLLYVQKRELKKARRRLSLPSTQVAQPPRISAPAESDI